MNSFALIAFVTVATDFSLAAFSIARARTLRHSLTALAAFMFSAADIAPDRLAGLYLVGLMGLLGSAIVMFSRVIRSILRPHSKAG